MNKHVSAELDEAFYTPREVAVACRMNYESVLDLIHAGAIPAVKFGRIYRVPVRWMREQAGSPEPTVHAVHEAGPVVALDLGRLASVLEILGHALVQAAGELRGDA
ncbi:excisionase family DNA binding protein [Kibdelosporangium banguiense]|uniref:Excisionase family DNA binding protein n=1 Tax=Kibdelosporangium banguiense TaxID=1365924 RepID=A0ABS4TAC9_9PSEU|nr:helix-turn-helix domain-containing protein [Kibdelosporangium banguiense]MBP2321385.1 excisionase family DNA binding protein [Kibdelosporangium banguiense]